jgi:exonuclease VII small subunit
MNPDSLHPYHSLPWLGRLTIHVAGYDESLKSGNRRAADRALRLAIIQRLEAMRSRLEEAIRQITQREATSHIGSLERAIAHLDRVVARIHSNDTRIEASYDEAKIGREKAGFLHAAHLAVFEQAEALVAHFDEPDIHHDRLPHLEADLRELENRLDEKATIYRRLD